MASVSALRRGLAERLDTIEGLHVYPHRPKAVNLPAAFVTVEQIDFDKTFARGADDLTLIVTVLVADPVDDLGEDELDDYCDGANGRSIKAAVENGHTLGGLASFAVVGGVRGFGEVIEVGGLAYISAEFVVEVCASGTS